MYCSGAVAGQVRWRSCFAGLVRIYWSSLNRLWGDEVALAFWSAVSSYASLFLRWSCTLINWGSGRLTDNAWRVIFHYVCPSAGPLLHQWEKRERQLIQTVCILHCRQGIVARCRVTASFDAVSNIAVVHDLVNKSFKSHQVADNRTTQQANWKK
jgi:hypothetical protein